MVNQAEEKKPIIESSRIPRWIAASLLNDQVVSIEREIFSAELKTSGELVVVISQRSFPLKSLEILSGLIFAMTYVTIVEPFIGDWLTYFDISLLVFGFFAAAAFGYFMAKTSWARRILLNDADSARLAVSRAELEFYRAGIGRTESNTGILIYIALNDHEVVVLADRGISSKLPPETWDDVVRMVLDGIKAKDLAFGLVAAVKRCGEILAEHFPIGKSDRNELENHLIFKD